MNKKKITIATSSLLAVGLATGATLAYLNSTTQTNTNVFSSSRSVEILLRENAWDGFNFDENYPKDETPGKVIDTTETEEVQENLGFTLAKNYYPGDVIPKDPTIKNVKEDAWVAIKVVYSDDTAAVVDHIDFDTTNWEKIKTSQDGKTELYMYKTSLAQNGSTTALFSNVTIKSTVTETKEFDIQVSGYGVQSHGVDSTTAKAELTTLAGMNK